MNPSRLTLFTNHMDAWGLTFAIALLALILHDAITPAGFILVISLTLCYWLGFALNDYFDARYDQFDSGKAARNYFVTHRTPRSWALGCVIPVALVTFLIFMAYGSRGLLIFALGYSIMWAYSGPPLRLKTRPVADLITHMLFVETFPYFVVVFLLGPRFSHIDFAMLSFFILASLAAQLEQQVRDYELDRRNETNFTTRFGLPVAIYLLQGVTLLLIADVLLNILAGVIPGFLLPLGIISLPIMLHRFLRGPQQPRSELLVRLTLLAGLLYTSLIWAKTALL